MFNLIPQWTEDGVLPALNESEPTSPVRSPYKASLSAFVDRFAITSERCNIIDGYLKHREKLHSLGMTSGFQWVDGSFLEHIELIENRPPNDVDVVTFFDVDNDKVELLTPEEIQVLVDNNWIKEHYKVDFYAQSLKEDPEVLVSMAAYWYSMWSHRRTMQWKGFLQIDLSPSDDSKAVELLADRTMEYSHGQE